MIWNFCEEVTKFKHKMSYTGTQAASVGRVHASMTEIFPCLKPQVLLCQKKTDPNESRVRSSGWSKPIIEYSYLKIDPCDEYSRQQTDE